MVPFVIVFGNVNLKGLGTNSGLQLAQQLLPAKRKSSPPIEPFLNANTN
jgi:hypothetical protein